MSALETCSTPDRGYMGDPRRGASLGRSNRDRESTTEALREDIARCERTLEQLADPTQAYLFRHLDDDGPRLVAIEQRANIHEARQRLERLAAAGDNPRWHLRRVHLDSGGYDRGGAYWGHGGQLFEAFTDADEFVTLRIYPADRRASFERHDGGYRSRDWTRQAAKDAVREEYPDARFYR